MLDLVLANTLEFHDQSHRPLVRNMASRIEKEDAELACCFCLLLSFVPSSVT